MRQTRNESAQRSAPAVRPSPSIRAADAPSRNWDEARARAATPERPRVETRESNRATTWNRGDRGGDNNRTGNRGDNDRDGRTWNRGDNDRDGRTWNRGDNDRDGRTWNRGDNDRDGRTWNRGDNDRDRNDGNRGPNARRDNDSWRHDDRRDNDWRNDRRQHSRSDNHRNWDRQSWRRDNRYDWRRYRQNHRSVYRIGRYYAPYHSYSYRRVSIGFSLGSLFYGNRYWINDPWSYRLPAVYGPYRWVRYYDDVLLVNTYTGEVVDVIYDFFW